MCLTTPPIFFEWHLNGWLSPQQISVSTCLNLLQTIDALLFRHLHQIWTVSLSLLWRFFLFFCFFFSLYRNGYVFSSGCTDAALHHLQEHPALHHTERLDTFLLKQSVKRIERILIQIFCICGTLQGRMIQGVVIKPNSKFSLNLKKKKKKINTFLPSLP